MTPDGTATGRVVRQPRHHDECFGCGPLSPHGLHIDLRSVDADYAIGRFRLRPDLQGPPKIGHGGVLAMALDEAMSLLVHIRGITARTVGLNVEYLAAARVGAELEVRATFTRQEGRRLFVAAEICSEGWGSPVARGTASFVAIGGDAP